MTTPLERCIERFLPAVEHELKTVLDSDDDALTLYFGMMRYHLGWVDSYFVPADGKVGKRIRPLICLLACDAAGGNWAQALPAAAAIELLHNFSLIHDDIEDDSNTRRGRDTVWMLWGVPQAINAGDSMFCAAFDALGRLVDRGVPPPQAIEALRVFTNACLLLTKGQHLDMWFENQPSVTTEQYLEMIAGKTAALISATAEIGAIVAGADADRRLQYREFGRNVGLAFQAYDDILGVWGDEAMVGKSTATDIRTRKKSLPVLYGLANSSDLRQCYREPEIDVTQVVELLDSIRAREYTLTVARGYSQAAIKHLEAAKPHGEAARALEELTVQLIRRQK